MTIYVSIVIDAPVADVWATIEPVERHVEWMTDAVAIEFETDQRRGAGTRFVCDTKVGPLRLRDRMEVTSWLPEREMGVRHRGLVTGTGMFTLTKAASGGTLFAWEESLAFPWWLGGRVGELVGGRLLLSAIWRRNLRRLKALVERQACDRRGDGPSSLVRSDRVASSVTAARWARRGWRSRRGERGRN